MNIMETYISTVLHNIAAPPEEKSRIEADLRAHLQEATEAGESLQAVLARMGGPLDVAAEFMAQRTLHYASFWRRAAAFFLDMIVIIPLVAILAILAIVFANLVPQHPQDWGYLWGGLLIGLTVICVPVIAGIILLYFPILEGRFGQTPGKKLLHLRVLKENGLPIGYREAFLRRLSFYFEGLLVLDAIFIPFTEKHQRAFDIVARTVVVDKVG